MLWYRKRSFSCIIAICLSQEICDSTSRFYILRNSLGKMTFVLSNFRFRWTYSSQASFVYLIWHLNPELRVSRAYITFRKKMQCGSECSNFAKRSNGNCYPLLYEYRSGGLLNQFPIFRYFSNVSPLLKHWLPIAYHFHIWQVSPQLSCGDTSQICKWFQESNGYFAKSKTSLAEKATNGALVTPTPGVKESEASGFHNWQLVASVTLTYMVWEKTDHELDGDTKKVIFVQWQTIQWLMN